MIGNSVSLGSEDPDRRLSIEGMRLPIKSTYPSVTYTLFEGPGVDSGESACGWDCSADVTWLLLVAHLAVGAEA